MLTPLLAKIRQNYPESDVYMVMQESVAPLYDEHPYGVTALPYNPQNKQSVKKLLTHQGFDLALIPGDNRYSWLAYAMGARWIVAFDGDRPAYKSWPVDEFKTYSKIPMSWADMNLVLIPGLLPSKYQLSDWIVNEDFKDKPKGKYVVFHPGASSNIKFWKKENWHQVADYLKSRNIDVVWGGGANEPSLIQKMDPDRQYKSYAGALNLKEYWMLIKGACLLICPDTGIAHLGRQSGTPTISLYGPGSEVLCGQSWFWEEVPFYTLSKDILCRNQTQLFKREIGWGAKCSRSLTECPPIRCMDLITAEEVIDRIEASNALTV
jgi:ADP-heptose:LPS heptosyltransferase